MARRPGVELADCSRCGACVDACPEVFAMNEAGFVEVIDRDAYPEDCVAYAVMNCPEDCIHWQED